VEVDATPAARSASVLKQTPIELTKSLDMGLLGRRDAENDGERVPLRRSKTSVSLTLVTPDSNHQEIPSGNETLSVLSSSDVNVTSVGSGILLRPELLPEETLENIRKRNFPKVLPDFPDKRLSLPHGSGRGKPVPPPRVSTLDRKHVDSSFHQSDSHYPVIPASSLKAALDLSAPSPDIRRIPKTLIVAHQDKPITRKDPLIIIPPSIGPTQLLKTSTHVNLQQPSVHGNTSSSSKARQQTLTTGGKVQQQSKVKPTAHFVDSKGPSDKVKTAKIVKKPELVQSLKRSEDEKDIPKCLVRTNALDDASVASSSSSSIAKESTGTIKRGGKSTKNAAT